jgi:hypothetical protein
MIIYKLCKYRLMNNKAIPTLLIATIMIAGAFAFMPVQEASTVHTTTASTQTSSVILQGQDATAVIALTDDDLGTITIQARDANAAAVPFEVKSVILCGNTGSIAAGLIAIETLVIDGDSVLNNAGAALVVSSAVDGDNKTACVDILSTLSSAQTTPVGLIGTVASDGGNVVFGFQLEEIDGDAGGSEADTITSVKVVVEARGDATTVFVDAALS